MNTKFIEILKEQEKAAFNELVAIQKLIELKGEKPNYIVLEVSHSKINEIYNDIEKNIASITTTIKNNRIVDGYQKDWSWVKKTKFAFEINNRKASPKQIIDFIANQEGIIEKPAKANLAANIYNVLSKLYRKEQYLNKIEGSDQFEVLPSNESGQMPLHKIED